MSRSGGGEPDLAVGLNECQSAGSNDDSCFMSAQGPSIAVVPGRVCGVREWCLDDEGGLSGYADFLWEDGGRFSVARCSNAYERRREDSELQAPHVAPVPSCTCGLYSLHVDPETVVRLAGNSRGSYARRVAGIIEVSGRVEVHPTGMRAERARPIALFLPTGLDESNARRIALAAHRYQAELLDLATYGVDELAEWCDENAPPLDSNFVTELLRGLPRVPKSATRGKALVIHGGMSQSTDDFLSTLFYGAFFSCMFFVFMANLAAGLWIR